MTTISENLQTIKSSTDAIKQAIINKGGTIEGDITTWADAISGISSGGSGVNEEYVFNGRLSYGGSTVTITGDLNKLPASDGTHLLVALGLVTGTICYVSDWISNTTSYTLILDFDEPITGNEIPAICILTMNNGTYTIIPVTFNKINGPSLDTEPA